MSGAWGQGDQERHLQGVDMAVAVDVGLVGRATTGAHAAQAMQNVWVCLVSPERARQAEAGRAWWCQVDLLEGLSRFKLGLSVRAGYSSWSGSFVLGKCRSATSNA